MWVCGAGSCGPMWGVLSTHRRAPITGIVSTLLAQPGRVAKPLPTGAMGPACPEGASDPHSPFLRGLSTACTWPAGRCGSKDPCSRAGSVCEGNPPLTGRPLRDGVTGSLLSASAVCPGSAGTKGTRVTGTRVAAVCHSDFFPPKSSLCPSLRQGCDAAPWIAQPWPSPRWSTSGCASARVCHLPGRSRGR